MVSCFKVTIIIAIVSILSPIIWKYRDQREFNYRTTAEEASIGLDLNGKVVIVTGANTGIGQPTARVLLQRGATVIMACRNLEKANNAKLDIIDKIMSKQPPANIASLQSKLVVIELDLGSFESIDKFITAFTKKYDELNYLVLNAGVNTMVWRGTSDGIERQFGVNHIGHFYLTMGLTPLMQQTAGAIKKKSVRSISRVIVVASYAHQFAHKPLTEWLMNDKLIQSPEAFGKLRIESYGFSKACNILFAAEYNKRYLEKGVGAMSLHPGTISTELIRETPSFVQLIWSNVFGKTVFKNVDQGAATTMRTVALTDQEFVTDGGKYYSDCNLAMDEIRSDLFPDNVDEYDMPQQMLWRLTETVIKKYSKDKKEK